MLIHPHTLQLSYTHTYYTLIAPALKSACAPTYIHTQTDSDLPNTATGTALESKYRKRGDKARMNGLKLKKLFNNKPDE